MKKKVFFLLLLIVTISISIISKYSLFAIEVGTRAPGLILSNLEGKKVSLSTILAENKPVIIAYFATWCEPCLKEIPKLQKVYQKTGIKVYLINIDNINQAKLSNFLKKQNITLPVLLDPGAKITGESYGVLKSGRVRIPKLFLLSGSGTIKYISTGFNENVATILEQKISDIEKDSKQNSKELTIIYTNSANGHMESCDCPTNPYGGLVRRATVIKRFKTKYSNSLVIDAGDNFSPYINPLLAQYLFKILEKISYDVIAIGDQELSYENFIKEMESYNIPYLSSNTNYCEGKLCRFLTPQEKVFNKQGLKIKILSVIDPDVFILYPEKITKQFTILPIDDFLENKQKDDCDLIILVSHSGVDVDKTIAEKFSQIDIIVGGHSQTLLEKPLKVKNTLILQAGQDGQNVGRITLKFDENKKIVSYDHELVPLTKNVPDDEEIRSLIEEYKQKVKKQ